MFFSNYFAPEVLKARGGFASFFKLLRNVIKRHLWRWISCVALGVLSIILAFAMSMNIRRVIFSKDKDDLSNKVEDVVSKPEKDVNVLVSKIKSILIQDIKIWDKQINFWIYRWEINCKFYQFLILVFILAALKSFFSVLSFYWQRRCSHKVEIDMKKDIINLYLFSKYKDSSIVSKKIQIYLSGQIETIVSEIWRLPIRFLQVVFSFGLYIFYSLKLGVLSKTGTMLGFLIILILVLLFSSLTVAFVYIFSKSTKFQKSVQLRETTENKKIFETIDGIEHIKMVSGEKNEKQKTENILDQSYEIGRKAVFLSSLVGSVTSWVIGTNIPWLFLVILYWLKSFFSTNQIFVFSNFAEAFLMIRDINSEVGKVNDLFLDLDYLTGTILSISNGLSFSLENEKRLDVLKEKKKLPFIFDDIIFEDVWFSYPRTNRFILKDVNFSFKKGKIYGISGKNGIGKSTITKTLLKLYEVNKGFIKIGDVSVQDIDSVNLHRSVCYQTNRPSFFSLSIADNIYYPENTPEGFEKKLISIAKKVGIEGLMSKLPQGINTMINLSSSSSVGFSEGEKQQISAMKIFINNYSIYIFDEILSNVKHSLKKRIIENIFEHVRSSSATVLVIDHHKEIFDYVDEIYEFTNEGLFRISKDELDSDSKEGKNI